MRSFRIPIFILLLTLLLCLFAGSSVARYTNAWIRQLHSAEASLSDLYGRWTEQQGWLHMIIVHQELDETEALLQRCIALAQQQDDAGLRSDIAELRTQFTLLSEMQRLTLRNIL